MDNGPGWLPDPEHEGQERYWDGSDWTDQVRPAGSVGSLHLPEHVPELQRALAAATADIDAVEDRLSSLFDRAGTPAGAGAVHRKAPTIPDEADDGEEDEAEDGDGDRDRALDLDQDTVDEDCEDEDEGEGEDEVGIRLHEEFRVEGLVDEVEDSEDSGDTAEDDDTTEDDDAFAELDAALAAEAPEKPERRFFRRKS